MASDSQCTMRQFPAHLLTVTDFVPSCRVPPALPCSWQVTFLPPWLAGNRAWEHYLRALQAHQHVRQFRLWLVQFRELATEECPLALEVALKLTAASWFACPC